MPGMIRWLSVSRRTSPFMGIRFPSCWNGPQKRQATACAPAFGGARMSGKQASNGDRRLLDKPGFAQKFLRRNPGYRCDYQNVLCSGRDSRAEREALAQRWGWGFTFFTGDRRDVREGKSETIGL